VVLGAGNTATTTTSISNSSNANAAFEAHSTAGGNAILASSDTYTAINAISTSGDGILGQSQSNNGVQGTSTSLSGVFGSSMSQYGVQGFSSATNQPASVGISGGNSTGVQGYSGVSLPAAKPKTGVYGYAAQDKYSRGVIGESPAGIGVYGISSTGYGVYAAGKVFTTQFYELTEIATPAAPVANRARLFVKDNGLGKTQLCVKFANGTVKVLATEG